MIFDVLIIGGGPAGATTGLLLAKAGWSVAIVEKKIFPRRKVCGEFISATNLPLLQKLGIVDFYLSEAGPEVRRIGLFAANFILTSAMPLVNDSTYPWGRALGREHLDKKLLDMAVQAGAELWQPWTVKTLQRSPSLFTSIVTSNEKSQQISARILIMANGSWNQGLESTVHRHKPTDLLAFKAHFSNCGLDTDLMSLLAFPGGYGGLVNSDHGRATLSCCIRRNTLYNARLQYAGLPAGEAVFQYISDACLGIRQTFTSAKQEGNWLAAGPIRPGIRKCYADGIFYVGNIAGEAHPIVAEGISMAIQSGWLLSHILCMRQNEILLGRNTVSAGEDYRKQWKAHFTKRIHAAALFSQLAMRPRTVAILLPLLARYPRLLTLGARWSGKTQQIVPATI
ncbi:NAD(P)/FAD-dependent oxidoreductase [soil metagenome]